MVITLPVNHEVRGVPNRLSRGRRKLSFGLGAARMPGGVATNCRTRPEVGVATMPKAESSEVTVLLQRMSSHDPKAADELLPLVYEELRKLARREMAQEPAGLTLQPTALVHEAYLRLLGVEGLGHEPAWQNRAHFFGAAAIAMRRILVERARSVGRLKRGGNRHRVELSDQPQHRGIVSEVDLIGLDDALTKLEKHDARKSQVVMLRYFAGLSVEQTAMAMNLSPTTVKADWNYARAWLRREIEGESLAEGDRDD